MSSGFRKIGEQEIYVGPIWRIVTAEFNSPDGERFRRDVVRSTGAVSVVPILDTADGPHVVLVRQWRPTIEREMLEVPAGLRDVVGEPVETTAARELEEEAGYRAASLELLTCYHPSAGMTDATHHVFLATQLSPTGRDAQGPEERHMTVVTMPFGNALEMVERGEITASNTVVGLLLADRRLHRATPRP